jgi:inorganic pyrophosphatase
VYKALEPHKHTAVRDWDGMEAAVEEIQISRQRFHEAHPGA